MLKVFICSPLQYKHLRFIKLKFFSQKYDLNYLKTKYVNLIVLSFLGKFNSQIFLQTLFFLFLVKSF